MPPQSKGKTSNHGNERPGRISWRETSLHGSTLILSLVKEAATFAPFAELKRAASVALLILKTIQAVKENKEAYERLGDDSGGLIVAIWRSYKKAEIPQDWLSPEMREILKDLTNTLEDIVSFVKEQLSRNKAIRVIFSRADSTKIGEYREHLNYAMQKFELQSHMNINDVLMQLVRKNDELSEQILHRNEEDDIRHVQAITAREARDREEAWYIHEPELKTAKEISALERLKQFEIHSQPEDERRHSEELKKIEKEAMERKLELERLRAAARAVELAQRLKEEEEAEMADLRRKIAVQEDGRRSTTIQVLRRDEVEEEEEWRGNVMVEEASSEEEEVRRPVRRSSKVKRNASKSPNRLSAASGDSTDDYEEDLRSLRSSKIKTARRKPSGTSLRVDEYTDEVEDYVSPSYKNNPKVNRKRSSTSRSPLSDVDDLMSQFQSFTPSGIGIPYGSRSNSRPSSPMYFPVYGASFSPPMGPYGHGTGLPGTIINSGVGNITNTNISNVGNDNSIRKIYHTPHPRSQRKAPGS